MIFKGKMASDKAKTALQITWTPELPWNDELPEDQKVRIETELLTAGEAIARFGTRLNPAKEDYGFLWSRVKKVHNFFYNLDGEIVELDAKQIANLSGCQEARQLIYNHGMHIFLQSYLTEEEEKNS